MCLRRRFKGVRNIKVEAGAKELILDLEERCCIRQLTFKTNMDDTTGTDESKVIIKIDEDEVLNESLANLWGKFAVNVTTAYRAAPFQFLKYDNTAKDYAFMILDLGRVERRFAIFFENKDTSNAAWLHCGVIYDILED